MPAPYPMDFRREAVALLKSSGKTVPQLAKELGVSPQSLRNWCRQLDVDEGRASGTSDEREELRRLRRELKVVTEEREILKKAAAFFAKESGTR
jgi:transposase